MFSSPNLQTILAADTPLSVLLARVKNALAGLSTHSGSTYMSSLHFSKKTILFT